MRSISISTQFYHMLRNILLGLHHMSSVKMVASRWISQQLHYQFSSQPKHPISQSLKNDAAHHQKEHAGTSLRQFQASKQSFLAFLSWALLYKLRELKPKQVYGDSKSSFRKQILKHVRTLKGRQNDSDSQYSKIIQDFLKAYEIGQGIQVQDIHETSGNGNQLKTKVVVLNPTSLTIRMLQQISAWNPSPDFFRKVLMMGNEGIGKSYNLLNLQYLSYHRFKLLFEDAAIKEIPKLILINQPFFSQHTKIFQKDREQSIKDIIHTFKYQPLILYYRIEPDQSWQIFYKKLVKQFPYLQKSTNSMPRLQRGERIENARQSLYKYKSRQFCYKIQQFYRQLKSQEFSLKVQVDQANQYLNPVVQQQKERENKEYDPQMYKTKRYKKIQRMTEKNRMLQIVHRYPQFHLIDDTGIDVFVRNMLYLPCSYDKCYIYRDLLYTQHLRFGFDLTSPIAQNQMLTVFILYLQQQLIKTLRAGNQNLQKPIQSFVSALNNWNIEQMVEETRKTRKFPAFTTSRIIYQVLKEIEISRYKILCLLLAYSQDKSREIQQQLKNETNKLFKDCLQKIQESKFSQVINNQLLRTHDESDQKSIIQFYRQFQAVLITSIIKDGQRMLNSGRNITTTTTFQQKQSTDEAFKGEFDGQLQGYITADSFVGNFDGTIISGQFTPNPIKELQNVIVKSYCIEMQVQNRQKTEMVKKRSVVNGLYGFLKNGVFYGKFKGKIDKGELIGKMTGELKGIHITAQNLQNQKQNTLTINGKTKTELQNYRQKFYAVLEQQLWKPTDIQSYSSEKKQQLKLRIIRDIKLPKYILRKAILNNFPYLIADQQLEKYKFCLLQSPNNFQHLYKQWHTLAISQLKGTLSFYQNLTLPKNFLNKNLKIVSNQASQFYRFSLGQDNTTNPQLPLSKHLMPILPIIQTLKPYQVIAARPIEYNHIYSTASEGIDILIITKEHLNKLTMVTVDYYFGQSLDQIQAKFDKNRQLYKQKFYNDDYFQRKIGKSSYHHFVVVYQDVSQKLKGKLRLRSYQSIVKLSCVDFKFDQLNSQTNEAISETAQRALAAQKVLEIMRDRRTPSLSPRKC